MVAAAGYTGQKARLEAGSENNERAPRACLGASAPGRSGAAGGSVSELQSDGAQPEAPPAPIEARPEARRSDMPIRLAFTLTTLLSALLLFSIQPMFAKMVLPLLGGSPSVWAVALLLLPGRAAGRLRLRAPARHRYVPPRITGLVHLVVSALAFLSLADRHCPPAGPSRRRAIPISGSSGCSPSRSGCRSSRSRPTRRCCRRGSRAPGIRTRPDPYFLYAALEPRQPRRAARLSASCSSRCSA